MLAADSEADDLSWITDEMFDRELKRIVREEAMKGTLLSVPGVYEAVSEHFNNDVIKELERKGR